MDTDWMSVGKCKDLSPTIFFPSDGVGVQAAQRICAECPGGGGMPPVRWATKRRPRRVWGSRSSVSVDGFCAGVGSVAPSPSEA